MAERDIVQNMISRLGQSQADRLPPELQAKSVLVDERTPADMLAQARALASQLRFYRDTPQRPAGDWTDFFPSDPAVLDRDDGSVAPHLGLFGSFLQLYGKAQDEINSVTARHLKFQMQDVLRFTPRRAQADCAHVLFELKKGAPAALVKTTDQFLAGKDARGVLLCYQPVRDVVINHSAISALHSVYHDASGIHFASIANSSDGLGGPLDAVQPKWRAFGGADLPFAQIGFALSAPALRMQEGTRTVTATLRVTGVDLKVHSASRLSEAFEAHLTGPKGWLGPMTVTATLSGDSLSFRFDLPETAPAVVDYNPKLHGQSFTAQAPVLQLLLKPGAVLHYDDLAGLAVGRAQIRVEVQGVVGLALENDGGTLNPKKAFQPFGPQPVSGARFFVGCEEALSKKLLDLKIQLRWQGAPARLTSWYAGYGKASQFSNGVGAKLTYVDRSGRSTSADVTLMADAPAAGSTLSPNAPPAPHAPADNPVDRRLHALRFGGSVLARLLGRKLELSQPMHKRLHLPEPPMRSGFITITLSEDFLHADYRRETLYNTINKVLDSNKNVLVLNEPYTPLAQSISLSYTAVSDEVDVGSNQEESFSNAELQFFQVGCFGTRRDHAFLRAGLDYVRDKRVPLLPEYSAAGELIIGLTGVGAGDSLSLLMQVAESSADPDLPAQDIHWAVLADNHWRELTPQELVLDTSRNLRASGIVGLSLPKETSTESTWLPAGQVWLRAAIPQYPAAANHLIDIAPNAVEVRFADSGNDPAHLAQPLAAASIAKSRTPLAGVKAIKQPYASFGGVREETSEQLSRRAAERLRHRNRCITAWDYERLLLENFPNVHKVKCIAHASATSWLAPGCVMLVVVPDLRNQNAVNPLQPKVDIDTLVRMRQCAEQHAAMQARILVKNPSYQSVRLNFSVRFQPGLPFNFYAAKLQDALIKELTPWIRDAKSDIGFGGRLYRSVLLEYVESQSYVDFVAFFKMGLAEVPDSDFAELRADRPDAVLVSDASHAIAQA